MRRTRARARVCDVLQPHSAGEATKDRRRADEVEDRAAACGRVEEMPRGIIEGGEGVEEAAEPAVRPKPGRATAWQGRSAEMTKNFEQKI